MREEIKMSEIIKVRKANMVLRVPADQKDVYLAKGFDVIDAKGKVKERNTKEVSPAEYNAVLEENKALKAEIEKLKAKKA